MPGPEQTHCNYGLGTVPGHCSKAGKHLTSNQETEWFISKRKGGLLHPPSLGCSPGHRGMSHSLAGPGQDRAWGTASPGLSSPNSHHHCLTPSHKGRKRQSQPQKPTPQALHSPPPCPIGTLSLEKSREKDSISPRREDSRSPDHAPCLSEMIKHVEPPRPRVLLSFRISLWGR